MLRLSYIADIEDAKLVERRMEMIKRQLTKGGMPRSRYTLAIEPKFSGVVVPRLNSDDNRARSNRTV